MYNFITCSGVATIVFGLSEAVEPEKLVSKDAVMQNESVRRKIHGFINEASVDS